MKIASVTFLFLSLAAWANAEDFKRSESWPDLEIKKITIPEDTNKPLQISFTITAKGKTPVALSKEQFSISLRKKDGDILTDRSLECHAVFPEKAPEVYTIQPDQSLTLSVATGKDIGNKQATWHQLPPSTYHLKISVHSGKSREFDYQWLGINHSNKHELEIK